MKKKMGMILPAMALVLSMVLVASPVAAQNDYYVANDGSDLYGDGTETWVDNDTSGDWSAGDTGPWQTIQHAIDQSSPGDTIIAKDGTYNEDLVVHKGDLTLRSQNGKDVTTIQLQGNVKPYIDLQAGADNFVLGGSEGEGFTILSSDGGPVIGFAIQLTNAPSGVTISHNTIDTTGDATMGISVGAAGAANLAITDNDFIAEEGDGSIWGPEVSDIDVSNNAFSGPGMVPGYAIQFWGVTASSPSVINDNDINGYTFGIVIGTGENTADLEIKGNTISGCSYGVFFYNGVQVGHTLGIMSDVDVICNTIENNDIGVYVSPGSELLADTLTIECNNIVDNSSFGLRNGNALQLSAERNWWGDASGPYNEAGNPAGTGNEVSDNVDFDPWSLTPDPCEPKTIGFWKNHPASLEAVLDGGTINLGDYVVADFDYALPVFANAKAKCAEDMLAPQLLAAQLNVLHLTHLGLYNGCIDELIASAQVELTNAMYNGPDDGYCVKGKDKAPLMEIACLLDNFNNGEMCDSCGGCPCEWD